MLARPLCSKSVCDMSEVWGRNWTWKLQLRQCQNLTRIKWLILSSTSVLVQPLKLFLKICKFIKFSQDAEPASRLLDTLMIALQVWILCNDCGKTSEVQFHVAAQKCLNCKSYNTRQTRGWDNFYDEDDDNFYAEWAVNMKTSLSFCLTFHFFRSFSSSFCFLFVLSPIDLCTRNHQSRRSCK